MEITVGREASFVPATLPGFACYARIALESPYLDGGLAPGTRDEKSCCREYIGCRQGRFSQRNGAPTWQGTPGDVRIFIPAGQMICWVIATASLTIAAALSSIRANPTNSWLPSAQARMEVENEQGSRLSLRGRGVSDLFRDVSLRDWFCRQPARAEID